MAEDNLKPGDVIWANRIAKGMPYNHCGIYEGGGFVIHFAAPSGSEISQENAVIHRTTLKAFQDDCPLRVIDFQEENFKTIYSPEETVRRARSRIGEKGYDFLTNNCDHFATWCKTGEHRSLQIDTAKNVVVALAEGVGEAICATHDILEQTKIPIPIQTDTQKHRIADTILQRLDINSGISETIPPVEETEVPEYTTVNNPVIAIPQRQQETDVIDRVASKLKKWTYAITGALEVNKNNLPPPLNQVDYVRLAPKIANGIDKIATVIKVVTGKIDLIRAKKEWRDADTALVGMAVRQKQSISVRDTIRTTFGRIGNGIKNLVQRAVTTFVPQPVRNAISTGFQRVGRFIVEGIRKIPETVGGFLKNIVSIFS
jgi:hypothetical protein